jgi:hypothetical protein
LGPQKYIKIGKVSGGIALIVNKINGTYFFGYLFCMEPTKFSIVEARFSKSYQVTFFLLGTIILISGISLLTVFINRNLGVQFRMQPLGLIIFLIFEYFLSSIVFASKSKGTIDIDDDSIKLKMVKENVKDIEYANIKMINLNKGKKIHFLASAKTPKIYTIVLYMKNGSFTKIKIENQVMNLQSLLPARIHEISEKLKIPLER